MSANEDEKAYGLRSKALLYMYTGQFIKAIECLDESCRLYKTLGYDLSQFRNLIYLANAYHAMRFSDEVQKSLDKANAILKRTSFSPPWLLYYGKFSIRTGRNIEGDSILQKMMTAINEGNRWDECAFELMKGEMEYLAGNYHNAEESFKTAVNLSKSGYSLESLAHYYMKTGKNELAEESYLEIIELKNLGWEAQPYFLEAHYQLGKLYEIKGDNSKAQNYYEQLIEYWKAADEDVPMLVDVRLRLKALRG
jgi:tetratricopeptide (TPR) repeat protein